MYGIGAGLDSDTVSNVNIKTETSAASQTSFLLRFAAPAKPLQLILEGQIRNTV